MKIIERASELREELNAVRGKKSIGFVPTMGALHAGHVSLVERARGENDVVVVSIFVNPTQFNDPNDLRNYPRTPEQDLTLLKSAGADIVFMPSVEEVYPEPDERLFDFGQIDKVMEGATRPGHFNGVGQVVSRLFEMVKPRRAYFGQKDFQQIAVIRDLVRQLRFGLEIVECPIVREEDGLAMSSRNALLLPEYRAEAPRIYRALESARESAGTISVAALEKRAIEEIEEGGLLKVIYFQVVDPRSLEHTLNWDERRGRHACVAVQAGSVRLIDNMKLM